MSTHDYVIANGSGATVRADINSLAGAIASNNSSGSDPSTMYAYQWYFDTGDNKMKMRNSANNAYIAIGTFTTTTTTITQTDANQTFTLAQRGSITTTNSTTGGAITLDMANNNYFKLSNNAGNGYLGSDNSGVYTLANPTNLTAGQSGSIFITQDGTGSRTLGYGTQWHFAGGTTPTLTTTASAVDRLDYVVYSTSVIHCVLSLDIKTGS
tara:strand:+ start:4785 stop:5417 length:633 start_codon:yes stop_codon:yes gene_type:complete